MQLKDLSKTIFWESTVDDSMLSKSTSTCAAPHSESAHMEASYRAQVAVTVQDLQRDIMNAIQQLVSAYTDRIHSLWDSLQQESKVFNKHPNPDFRNGSNASDEVNVANSVAAGTARMHGHTSVPVGRNQGHAAATLSDCHLTHAEQSILHKTDLLAPKVTTQGAPLETEQHIRTNQEAANQEMSSFIQLPSFSQDSSSNTVNCAAHSQNPMVIEKYNAKISGSSVIQDGQNHLQPRIRQSRNSCSNVFLSLHSSSSDTSHQKEAKVLGYNTVTIDSNIDQVSDDTNDKQSAQNNDFNFWGSGIDSNFEVKPPRQAPMMRNILGSSINRKQNKRSRSLNESIYDAIICIRKKRQQQSSNDKGNPTLVEATSTHITTAHDEGIHAVNINEITELQDSSNKKSAPPNCDEEMQHHMDMDNIILSTPSTQSKFCYNFCSQLVEKEVFKDIIDRIPFSGPRYIYYFFITSLFFYLQILVSYIFGVHKIFFVF